MDFFLSELGFFEVSGNMRMQIIVLYILEYTVMRGGSNEEGFSWNEWRSR